ncbi:hypothetical protein FHX64_001857 [Microbacter margulisiae]|uniref:Uncharacterized protein n=1 Tax=Microbacter margulisiae TaxID=1350067 RepID=A0A7W5DRD0_9PORP|nr:hypothetical protein [Microbacter margulisiae]
MLSQHISQQGLAIENTQTGNVNLTITRITIILVSIFLNLNKLIL